MSYKFYDMKQKNKQYKIAKGLMLFTQPKSPFFYGKIRINGRYVTKSFAPISDFQQAKDKLMIWKDELDNKIIINTSNSAIQKNRDEYLDHKKLNNNFQFLDVGRYDPPKKTLDERKISFVEIYSEFNKTQAANQSHRCLDCGNPYC